MSFLNMIFSIYHINITQFSYFSPILHSSSFAGFQDTPWLCLHCNIAFFGKGAKITLVQFHLKIKTIGLVSLKSFMTFSSFPCFFLILETRSSEEIYSKSIKLRVLKLFEADSFSINQLYCF